MPVPAELTRGLAAQAAALGFSAFGVASAEPFGEAERLLLDWLQQERHGQMGWLDEARARRSCRPEELLPGARSLVVVAAPYTQAVEPPPPPLHGRVARYARGQDYHDVLGHRLRQLVVRLRQLGGDDLQARLFVDSGPLLEREAAVRAGLGFIGKNTCLIVPGAGSFLLLGAILTDLELGPTPRDTPDCGRCRLCLDACPTGALTAPRQLDARRCIAYLTIELRGPISPDLRSGLGARLFGCDICQEVCPWNRGRGRSAWPEFAALDGRGPDLDLAELLGLDDQTFRQRFRGSPIKRAKRRGLLRNAAIVLGNLRDRRAVPALARTLLQEPEPLVRAAAAWALGRLGGRRAEEALAQARDQEQEPHVRAELPSEAGLTC